MTHSIPYIVSGLTASVSFLAQAQPAPGSWHSIAIQAGMAGVGVLLLLKFFPMVMQHLERKDKEHQAIIREIVGANQVKDAAWQAIVNEKKLCPKDKHGN